MKKTAIFLLLPFLALAVSAQTSKVSSSITRSTGDRITVEFVNDNIVKVTVTAPGETTAEPNMLDVQGGANVQQTRLGNKMFMSSASGLNVILDGGACSVTIDGGPQAIVSDNGVRTLADGRRELTLATSASGAWYGAGERGHSLDLSGDTLVMFNRQNYGYTAGDPRIRQMNITMPLVISQQGFALVFDDYAAAELIMSNPIKYVTESPRPISYYYVKGASTVADVVEQMSALTGRQPLPPLWALGYITSKYGYRTQQETLGVIDTLKREGYPVDGVVLDLYWYGKEEDMGRLAWDPEQWPDAAGMLKELKDQGVNTVIISQPYILRNGRGIDNYRELTRDGLVVKDEHGNPLEVKIWVGEGGMFDVSNPATRRWLSDRYGQLTDMGVGGWWGDLGEPEVHPDSAIHANGLTMRQYHNLYGNDWSKIISDLFAEKYPDRRLLTMMRGGTTGLQRYSVFPWSTDVSRSWGGLQPQVRIMLNSGLSGLGYMGHDVGGFAVEEGKEYQPELYLRWLQLGTFSPMLRTHAQQFAEPYLYPQYGDVIRQLVLERYRWLPYNYSLAWENATKGYPMVRPLNFYENDPRLADVQDEYLWGPEVLVAPVMHEGAVSRDVVLPSGVWVDYHNPSMTYTGRISDYSAPLEVLPLFVRNGAIIPQADYKMANTGDYDPSRLDVKIYPATAGCRGKFTLYDDNRLSPASLSSGQYRLLNFMLEANDNRSTVTLSLTSEGRYNGAPDEIEMTVKAYTLPEGKYSVTYGGQKVRTRRDADGALTMTFKYRPSSNINQLVIRATK